ncbi:transposase [Streptomyces sp. NPDC001107]
MSRGDLTDTQGERLEAVLPPIPKTGRPPRDRRQVFDGIWWRARTGSPWRDVSPSGTGPGRRCMRCSSAGRSTASGPVSWRSCRSG